MNFKIAAENAVIFYLDDAVNSQTIQRLKWFNKMIIETLGDELIDSTPSYRSILICFNAMKTDHQNVIHKLTQAFNNNPIPNSTTTSQQLIRLPVFYDATTGPDLPLIAEHHGLSIEEVITRHCMAVYEVCAIGFAPGFAYLGSVDESIAMPRLATPRVNVPKGSVGIADRQTAIYPAQSPGGWNIIGRCPSLLFNPNAEPAMPFNVGDRVQFMPINEQEFLYLGGELWIPLPY